LIRRYLAKILMLIFRELRSFVGLPLKLG